jgi:hypothetical protein
MLKVFKTLDCTVEKGGGSLLWLQNIIIIIIIINIKGWTIWLVPSPELQLQISRQRFFGLPTVLLLCGL